MKTLSDESLIEVYLKAVEFNLDQEFVKLIIDEMKRRGIHVPKNNDAKSIPPIVFEIAAGKHRNDST